MENVRNRSHIDIITTSKKLKTLVAEPTFNSITPFNEEISTVERSKAKVYMSKPIYVVLALSKLLRYDFYNDTLKQLFPNVRLFFTDTDSLSVCIEGCDYVYKRRCKESNVLGNGDIVPASTLFDVSGYSSKHPRFDGLDEEIIARIK